MNRRAYLRQVVAASGLTLVAGCLESGESLDGGGSDDDGPVSILDHSFEAVSPECGEDATAEITVSNGTIAIEGSVAVSDLCQRATLAETTADDDTLYVTIATEEYQEMCGQCLAEAGYTLTVDLSREPASVEVAHDGHDGVEIAATWSA